MASQGSGRACLFCGRRPVTAEHVFPDWLTRWLQDQGLQELTLKSSHWGERESTKFDITVKRFCESCNGVWMSDMEKDVKPILTTMIRDTTPRTVLPVGQAHLARWAFKTMLTLWATQPEKERPALDIYRGFRRWQTPPAGVWIGKGPDDLTVRFDVKRITHDQLEEELFQMMLLIGHVFIATIYASNPSLGTHLNPDTDRYVLIWPPHSPGVVWPPPIELEPDSMFPSLH